MEELKRTIGFKSLLFIVINSIMGTGIFFLPAVSAKVGGPSAVISWLVMSLVAIYISMIFAELSSMYPTSGGIYDYCKHAYGRGASFLIGWITFLVGNITIAMLIIGAIQYLFGQQYKWLTIILSAILIIIFNILSYRGMKTSIKVLVFFAFVTLITIVSLIIPGIIKFDISHFSPFFTHAHFSILLAIFYISETFFGWESITFLAGEVKEGHKTVPKALIMGTIIIGIISFIFVITSFGSIPIEEFAQSDSPLTDLGIVHYEQIGGYVFTFLVFFSIIGSVADWIVSSPRLVHALSRDKLFLVHFKKIHKKYGTPYRAITLQCIVSILMVIGGAGAYENLLEMLVPLLLILYSIVIFSHFVLRRKKPEVKRYYRTPFGNVGPILIVALFLTLLIIWINIAHNALQVLWTCLLLVILGYPIYFLLEMYYNPRAIIKANNLMANFALLFEKMFLPNIIREYAIEKLDDIEDKKIIEYGCSVGTMSKLLLEKIGPNGFLHSIGYAEREIEITKNRLKKSNQKNFIVYHDPDMLNNINKKLPSVDIIISINTFSNFQDPKKMIRSLRNKLKNGGKILIIEADKFFDIINNSEWLTNDKEIISMFKKSGIKVEIERSQGNAWEYIFIFGELTTTHLS